jgi:hypothetical protein
MLNIFSIGHLRQTRLFQLFTIYLRYLIGSTFVIAAFGMGKVLKSFPIAADKNAPAHSISHLFETFTNAGLYWQFIGWSQIIAGLLLMTQKYSRLGAVVFFPIILNIFVITISYDFHGTPIITGLVLLANIYLLVWDYKALQFLLIDPSAEDLSTQKPDIISRRLWISTGFLLFATIVVLSILKIHLMILMLTCLLEGILALIFFLLSGRYVERYSRV